MTHAEAYRQMYGSVSNMMTVLRHRRAIAEEALATIERLRKKLEEGFPPVDSAGADLDLQLRSNVGTLRYRIEAIEKTIAECAPTAAAPSKKAKTPASPGRPRTRRKK